MRSFVTVIMFLLLSLAGFARGRHVCPSYMQAEGYPAHVHLKWDGINGFLYSVYRLDADNGRYVFCGESSEGEFMDFSAGSSDSPRKVVYRICPDGIAPESDDAAMFQVSAVMPQANDSTLLDMVQKYTVKYFSEFSHRTSGMARERSNDPRGSIVTTGGTGFGMMALIAGAERGFISREEVSRIFSGIVNFLAEVERFHGAWAHWYDADSGRPFNFSKYDDGGDIVETAFLVQGLLTARQWLREAGDSRSLAIAARCDSLSKGVEWSWYTNGTDSLYWHWSKNYGWKMKHRIRGFDETMITYVLAAGSETYPVGKKVYDSCYKESDYYYNDAEYYGLPIFIGMPYGGPLFFTHYSFLGLDPRGLSDGRTDYFVRNRNHSLIHYRYALDNPKGHEGYGPDLWGFTSSDDPLVGYCSHHPMTADENGTVSPTAAVSSIVYTPQESLQAIRHMYYDLGEKLFGPYGFYDAYNPSMCKGQQVVRSYLAIDQGPQAVMIENYRSGLLWKYFMSCPEVIKGLEILGFTVKEQEYNQ